MQSSNTWLPSANDAKRGFGGPPQIYSAGKTNFQVATCGVMRIKRWAVFVIVHWPARTYEPQNIPSKGYYNLQVSRARPPCKAFMYTERKQPTKNIRGGLIRGKQCRKFTCLPATYVFFIIYQLTYFAPPTIKNKYSIIFSGIITPSAVPTNTLTEATRRITLTLESFPKFFTF